MANAALVSLAVSLLLLVCPWNGPEQTQDSEDRRPAIISSLICGGRLIHAAHVDRPEGKGVPQETECALRQSRSIVCGPKSHDNVVIGLHKGGPGWHKKILWFDFRSDSPSGLAPRAGRSPQWLAAVACDAAGERGIVAIAKAIGFRADDLQVYEFEGREREKPSCRSPAPIATQVQNPSQYLRNRFRLVSSLS